jgi:hypothetical protein
MREEFCGKLIPQATNWAAYGRGFYGVTNASGAELCAGIEPNVTPTFSLSVKTMRRFSQPHPDGRAGKSLPSTGYKNGIFYSVQGGLRSS